MKNLIPFYLLIALSGSLYAQVGIGITTPNPSAALDITSTSGGLLVPRMSNSNLMGIATPATGLLVYQTDGAKGFYYYTGSAWVNLSALPLNLASSTSVTGTLPVSSGGTGVTNFTLGNVLFGLGNGTVGTSSSLFWDTATRRLGIGTSSPSVPLQITSTMNYTVGSYGYLNSSNPTGINGSTTAPFSVLAAGRIGASEFNATSDERIKENINSLQTSSSSGIINQLRPVTFQYIDKPAKGNETKYGFIAQEVEKWAPSAVRRSTDFIPNIFSVVSNGSTTIACNTAGIQEGDEIKLITTKGEKIVKVKSVHNGSMDLAARGGPHAEGLATGNSITLDWADPDQHFLVYGTKVNDLRAIDYDQLVALSVSAIQEQDKKIQELNRKLENQQESLAEQFKKMTKKERRQLRRMLK